MAGRDLRRGAQRHVLRHRQGIPRNGLRRAATYLHHRGWGGSDAGHRGRAPLECRGQAGQDRGSYRLMAWGAEKVLAVVPARGGSKGIPRKNLRKVGGLSLIARAASVIRELPWIDRAVISTDDPDMAEEGRRHALDVPFTRPAILAGDTARGPDV